MIGKVVTKLIDKTTKWEWESDCCLTSICQLYHGESKLDEIMMNADLFRVHLANDPGCTCGCAFEDAIHFIIECCLYNEAREELKLRLKIEVLLFGDDT